MVSLQLTSSIGSMPFYISPRFYQNISWWKDHLILIEKDLSNVVLFDNNPTAYSLQPWNGLPIIDFYRENDLDK